MDLGPGIGIPGMKESLDRVCREVFDLARTWELPGVLMAPGRRRHWQILGQLLVRGIKNPSLSWFFPRFYPILPISPIFLPVLPNFYPDFPDFTIFSLISPIFTQFYPLFPGFYLFSPSFPGFPWFTLDFL